MLNPVNALVATMAAIVKFFMRFFLVLANLSGYDIATIGLFHRAAEAGAPSRGKRLMIRDQRRPQGIAAQTRSCR